MSLAMRSARAHVGDPGLFGFLGGIAKGAIGGLLSGGPAGAILGGAAGAVSQLVPKPVSVAKSTSSLPVLRPAGTMFPTPVQGTPGFSGVSIGGPGGVRVGTSTPAPVLIKSAAPGGAPYQGAPYSPALTQSIANCKTLAGYHLNRHAYYDAKGYHGVGTVCVKNRRRNPLNPRALSRAMSRVKSAQRAVRCLQLFAGPAARASAKGGGKRRAGGRCRTCR
jgi:hypothetical protein